MKQHATLSTEFMTFMAYVVPEGMPTTCIKYAVVDQNTGKEICRVWEEDDCTALTDLLNAAGRLCIKVPAQ